MRPALLVAFVILTTAASPARAQRVSCNLLERPGGEMIISNAGQPTESGIIYRAHFVCDGGERTMISDTATYSRASGQIVLFGRVEVSDPGRVMRSAQATYFTNLRQLSASGNVVVTDRETGSVIQGDLLNMLEQTPDRPESQLTATATSGLARATLLRERAAEPGVRDTTVVEAAQIHIVGDRLFRGLGNAVLTRDSLRATGAQIEYSQQAGSLEVVGDARVELPSYALSGDSITAELGDDDEIRGVLARHQTVLASEELNVTAPGLRLFFEDGGLSRLVAMPWPQSLYGPPAERPRAWSAEFRMEADSLDVLAPGQQIREAAAVGTAHVERITPDSLRGLLPDADPPVLALIQNDWVRGDTVRAFFTAGPEPAGEGTEAERVLERLWTTGEPAQAMHRTRDENAAPDARLSIAYLVGREIEVTLDGGAVTVVAASEDVRGVYLQPAELARRTGGGRAVIPPGPQQ
jgi:lipopolysaccharide export system protein LptA